MVRYVGHVTHTGKKKNAHKVRVKTPEKQRPLGIFQRKWEANIKMDLKEKEQ
jgi:hypothetical protein